MRSGLTHIVAGYASGCLRCFDLEEKCEVWGTVRHPSGVIAVIPHPQQEAIMCASRWEGATVKRGRGGGGQIVKQGAGPKGRGGLQEGEAGWRRGSQGLRTVEGNEMWGPVRHPSGVVTFLHLE